MVARAWPATTACELTATRSSWRRANVTGDGLAWTDADRTDAGREDVPEAGRVAAALGCVRRWDPSAPAWDVVLRACRTTRNEDGAVAVPARATEPEPLATAGAPGWEVAGSAEAGCADPDTALAEPPAATGAAGSVERGGATAAGVAAAATVGAGTAAGGAAGAGAAGVASGVCGAGGAGSSESGSR
jgi:hypothetical protein